MSVRAGKDTLTLDLFAVPEPVAALPASMDYGREISNLIGQVFKEAEGDRYEIAAQMSRLSGHEIHKTTLDGWAAESRDAYNIPFYQVAVLEVACHTHELGNWLADKRGGRLLVGKETLNAELGKLERLKAEAARKIRELKKIMGELE